VFKSWSVLSTYSSQDSDLSARRGSSWSRCSWHWRGGVPFNSLERRTLSRMTSAVAFQRKGLGLSFQAANHWRQSSLDWHSLSAFLLSATSQLGYTDP
jgi:hypothetical protein